MILSIVVLIFVLGIAFFHYTQGFFSSTISAICAVIAACFALSLHETVVESLLAGKIANVAHGLVLMLLFTVIYMTLRILFDTLVPGQIRLPVLVDKIGGAVMGIVAGIFGVGILMIAMQEFPLGTSLVGYTRYETKPDRGVIVPQANNRMSKTIDIYDELKSDQPGAFDDADKHTLYVDDIVVNTVAWLSSSGSLSGSQPLNAIHPDLLTELFGQRLGIEPGGKGVALNLDKQQIHDVKVDSLYSLATVTPVDSEFPRYRTLPSKYTKPLPPDPGSILLTVRVLFTRTAADTDGLIRVSPGSVRLVAPTNNEATPYADYYPIGTLQGSSLLFVNKLDDPLYLTFGDADSRGADFVFMVTKEGFVDTSRPSPMKVASGVFLEVKRLGRVDLSGTTIQPAFVLSPTVAVMRKPIVAAAFASAEPAPAPAPAPEPTPTPAPTPAPAPMPAPTPTPTPEPAPTPAPTPATSLHSPQAIVATANSVFDQVSGAVASDQLPIAIGVGNDNSHLSHALPGGDAIIKNDKLLSLNLDVQETQDKLAAGDHPVKQLLAPDGQGLIIVQATAAKGGWSWADKANQFSVADAAGNHYPANGAWADVDQGGAKKLVARYSTNYPLDTIPAGDGKVSNVWLCFPVPAGTEVKQLLLGTDVIGDFPPVKAQSQ